MINPTNLLPFTYEGLEFFKRLVIRRLNVNSFIYADEINLNAYNSNTTLTYLNKSSSYVGRLRNEINKAYIILNSELSKTKSNINGPSQDEPTIKANTSTLLVHLTNNQNSFIRECEKKSGNWGTPDLWNYTPWFSCLPEYPAQCSNHGAFARFAYVSYSFPYLASIGFESNDAVEFTKNFTDLSFLDDANKAIEVYYRAKSAKLLEYAASLAALEIQMAMYLDDEDYQAYVNTLN